MHPRVGIQCVFRSCSLPYLLRQASVAGELLQSLHSRMCWLQMATYKLAYCSLVSHFSPFISQYVTQKWWMLSQQIDTCGICSSFPPQNIWTFGTLRNPRQRERIFNYSRSMLLVPTAGQLLPASAVSFPSHPCSIISLYYQGYNIIHKVIHTYFMYKEIKTQQDKVI